MKKLPKISNEELHVYFHELLLENHDSEMDLFFIYLFQDSNFTKEQTLSMRIKKFIEKHPNNREIALNSLDRILDFLISKDILTQDESQLELRKILDVCQK